MATNAEMLPTNAFDMNCRDCPSRSIAYCTDRTAELKDTTTARKGRMLDVYTALLCQRKALLWAVEEGHPERWLDYVERQ